MRWIKIVAMSLVLCILSCLIPMEYKCKETTKLEDVEMNYEMVSEDSYHEGTWLTWPHPYTYGQEYQEEIEDIWVQLVSVLHVNENVHIIAFNKKEQRRIEKILKEYGVDMKKVDFTIVKSNDVWIRDTGPIFVYDENENLVIANFKFDGWGEKVDFEKDDKIPVEVGKQKNIHVLNIPDLILEGGSIELDGHGTLMGNLSSILSDNRNPSLTLEEVEELCSQYLGVTNFIWLDGVLDEDITDAHIDGVARFVDNKKILTVSKADFNELYESIQMKDYNKLRSAKNSEGDLYEILEIPLTKKNVHGLDYKGSYLNYYVANGVVIVPVYDDEHDKKALEILSKLYSNRKIVPINVTKLYPYGGMIHCITQQQPGNLHS